jgi:hypothetical protein
MQVAFASSKRRAESMRRCLGSVCVGRPSFGGRRAVFDPRKRFCSGLGVGCLSFGSPRMVSYSVTRFTCTVVPITQLSGSAAASAAMGKGRLLPGHKKVVFLCSCFKAPSPRSISAVAAMKKDQSLPWQRPPSSSSFHSSLVVGFRPVRPAATVVPSRHMSCRRVGPSHLRSGGPSLPRLHAGLTSRCSGLPSAAAELQR